MEFDERLHRTFDALAERVHHEIAAQLNTARNELSASLSSDHERTIAETIREARATAEREADQRFAETVATADKQVRDDAEGRERASSQRLLEATRAIDASHSLSDILEVLVASAAAEVGRTALFLPQGSTLKAWRLVGFDRFGAEDSSVELPFADGGIIADAAETGRLVRLDSGSRAARLPAFVDLSDERRALAVPLVMTSQVFAVLYVDEGAGESAPRESWPATIEVLARHAARSLEAITASRLAQVTEVVSR